MRRKVTIYNLINVIHVLIIVSIVLHLDALGVLKAMGSLELGAKLVLTRNALNVMIILICVNFVLWAKVSISIQAIAPAAFQKNATIVQQIVHLAISVNLILDLILLMLD